MNETIKIMEQDNVVVALKHLKKGNHVQGITLLDDIHVGHKIAIKNIAIGEKIIKYGAPIGSATSKIARGAQVHTHNIKTNLDAIKSYEYTPKFEKINQHIPEKKVKIYRRNNGDIGIRNELWIVPTVGCVNSIAYKIAEEFKKTNDSTQIDGVHVFSHKYGCSQMGDDHENTKVSLQSIVKHPNAGGVLVLGLGCENNQIKAFKETLGDYDHERVLFLESQEVDDEIVEGLNRLKKLYQQMKRDKREEAGLSELKIGLECGGSDGFSGITANPLVGLFSDYLISHGGTTVLTEVPEMFGAETILMNGAKNEGIFLKIVKMINDFKQYYKDHGQVIYENPSPGNDLVATTSLGIVGCHLVLFTTGRGTPFGGFVPTVKIATNSRLANKKKHWIDFNAGNLAVDVTMDELIESFIDYIINVVNGEKTKNEINNAREIAIFKSGVTL